MLLFLWHQILGQIRSVFWKKNLVVSILSTLFLIYIFINVILLGFFLDIILVKMFPDADLFRKTTQLLSYYFIADILLRFVFQKLPVLAIQYYSLLPIKRSKLLHFPLAGSAISLLNILPVLILLIFFFKQVINLTTWYGSVMWLLSMLLIIFSNNYINFSLKKRFGDNPFLVILILLGLTAVLIAEGFGLIKAGQLWVELIFAIMDNPFLILIPILYLCLSYFFGYQTVSVLYYPDNKKASNLSKNRSFGLFKSLRRFGVVGRLVEVELKLIFRNKRPRTMLLLSILFGVYIYSAVFRYSDPSGVGEPSFTSNFIMLGIFLFSSGWMMIMYGQLLFAWESNYFNGILNQRITTFQYISAKYWLLTMQNLVSIIFVVVAVFINLETLVIGLSCFLYNIGVNTYFIIFAGMFNTSKVDPDKSAFMNYQGANVIHFFLVFLLMGIPALLYLPFQLLGYSEVGIVTIGLTGLVGFFLRNFILGKLSEFFLFRKYILAKGYKDF